MKKKTQTMTMGVNVEAIWGTILGCTNNRLSKFEPTL